MKKLIFAVFAISLFSCSPDGDGDKINKPPMDGSIALQITIEHLDSLHDVIKTKQVISTNKNKVTYIDHADTIPSLGKIVTEGEDSEGNTKSFTVSKDYELYITVAPHK